ncbi:MAG: TIGR03943 family protein [Candidatus Saccharibacteria bacterium]|nr:TIGR03943 family protein [Candidatus Saccharibacteria bacterium]
MLNSGAVVISMLCIAILAIAVRGQLKLYIHPRYEWLTISMTLLGLLLSVMSVQRSAPVGALPQRGVRLMVVCGVMILPMLVTKPVPLTVATASQRVINSSAAGVATEQDRQLLASRGEYAHFTVKDWAGLLAQSTDPAHYQHKAVRIVGFVAPSPNDTDVFFVSRFVIACCAVDARPVGVPVYRPGWQRQVPSNAWVEVSGEFAATPGDGTAHRTVVLPDYVKIVPQPEDPYAY